MKHSENYSTRETSPIRCHMELKLQLQQTAPLADQLRPQTLEEIVGQVHLTGPNSLLFDSGGASGSHRSVTTENVIFWGPPG